MFPKVPKYLRHLICAFGSSVVVYRYHSYIGTVVYCEGISMEPTVSDAIEDENVTYWDEAHCTNVIREVPPNHVWLEGDNSGHSLDSRNYGPVPTSRLEYRVLLRLWPLTSFGRLSTHEPNPTSPPSVPNSSNLTTSVEACSDYALLDEKNQV
ncbi:Mitochondrial inner membrane protease subunit 1 [Fasciola hepatica]|uniref:Mitochondrial inner membrane protease subunit 1 n=1 Tax=Fasciola hepatica TaxID=6192 RepID=A0A4E0S3W5_FASHE|nr:Mitochondrial inner membrane protease subunit 1 [Fasciola hepatica]